jgi:hypothetical protein
VDPVLEPDRRFAHGFLARGELLERVGDHEVPEAAVVVEILHLALDDVRGLDAVAGLEVPVERAPVLRLRIRTRLKAWPLPGLTNSFSTIVNGSPSRMILRPERNSLVL